MKKQEKSYMLIDKYKDEINSVLNAIDEMSVFCGREEIADCIGEDSLSFLPNGAYKKDIIKSMYDYQKNKVAEEEIMIDITQNEYDYIKSIQETKLRKLCYCLVLWRRVQKEERNYVRFEFKNILSLFFTNKEIEKIKQEDFAPMCKYGLDFRVVGKKKPRLCYSLPVDISGDIAYSFNKNDIKQFWGDNFVSV